MADFVAWHNKTLTEHTSLRDTYMPQGYRFLSLSIYSYTPSPFYAAVMIKPSEVVAQHDYPLVAADQFQQTFNDEAAKGYGPVIIAASGPASNPIFAAVFEPQNPIPLTRFGLRSGSSSDTTTIQGMNNTAKQQGLILSWAAAYGDSSDPAFAAIWMPNTGRTMWNTDGVSDSANDYQSRFNAQTSQWCRPAFVTLNPSPQYFSLFVDSEISGGWYARHGMTADEYQTEFNTWTAKGYFPGCVQAAAGIDPISGVFPLNATFAAIFVKSEDAVQKQFTATGLIANANIDNIIKQDMQAAGPVRHASLAIVHGTQLVYARGYTLAEPDWPTVQPTTCFRLASCSKTPTALALFQLIEEGKLKQNLSDKLQDLLKLTTPAGEPPTDPRFSEITIQHLLEHTSAIDGKFPDNTPEDFTDSVAIKNAFIKAGHPATLPVTNEMTDSYIASFILAGTPGKTQAYSSCGYYLLGRVVAKLRNMARPIDAYQQYLFNPLSITRIRRAQDLVVNQLKDEARYQDPNLNLAASVLSDSQPLVPDQYGSQEISIDDGGGGVSGAATDLARLIAILISQNDNPALKRSTLDTMLSAGSALTAEGMGRAGYGFDQLIKGPGSPPADTGSPQLSSGQFYGQKGGDWVGTQSVLQFNGDWGFVMLWAGQNSLSDWYPDYPAVMNIAKATSWGSADLFPQFGMPSL